MSKPALQPAECETIFPEAKVAPVKISRPRTCEELGVCQCMGCSNCQDLSESLLNYLSAPDAPGARGNVWFAEPEPTDPSSNPPDGTGSDEPKREPLTRIELIALVLLVCMSVASSLSVVAGVWWLLSVDGAFA